MLIVRIGVSRLGGVPHDLIGSLLGAANQRAAAGGRNHLVAVERQDTVLAKSAQHLPIETGAHAFGRILDHRNPILCTDGHDLVDSVWHPVQRHRHNRLRVPPGLLLPVDDCRLQQLRVHIPRLPFRAHEHRLGTQIRNRMRRSTERETLHQHLIPSLHTTSNHSQMHRRRPGRKTNHLAVEFLVILRRSRRIYSIHEPLQILLERIHIRSHRHHPVRVERFFHVLLFPTFFAHVSQA